VSLPSSEGIVALNRFSPSNLRAAEPSAALPRQQPQVHACNPREGNSQDSQRREHAQLRRQGVIELVGMQVPATQHPPSIWPPTPRTAHTHTAVRESAGAHKLSRASTSPIVDGIVAMRSLYARFSVVQTYSLIVHGT
jgi:hypothetical protein